MSFCHWTLIESQRKTVVSVTGAAAPRQDITGIYDVLNVSFVPPCGSSLWQLGKAAACNELIIPPPSPLSVSSSVIVVQNYFDRFVFPAVNHTIRDVTNTILACSWIHSDSWIFVSLTETQRGMHFTRVPPSLKPEIDLISLLFSFQYCGKKKKYETQPWHFAKVQNANRLFFPAYSAPEINPLRHSIWQTHLGWRVGAGKGEV